MGLMMLIDVWAKEMTRTTGDVAFIRNAGWHGRSKAVESAGRTGRSSKNLQRYASTRRFNVFHLGINI